jgi:mRNA-degrading endonuclease RelE of RelBE toxin-antitoxin system
MNFNELPDFSKELKRLAKKYQSLPEDLVQFKQILRCEPLGNTKHFSVLIQNDTCTIMKARFFCRYLKGGSLRIIYAFHPEENLIKFIELYFKGEKETENKDRIRDYVKTRK